MTQEEKTIKLAEAAGFTDIMLPMGFHQQMSDEKSKKCGGRWRFKIPNYFEDLNAVHELEKVVKKVWGKYVKILNSITDPACATAAQRCEAIGKTLGLW
jgi:hypothetical protein